MSVPLPRHRFGSKTYVLLWLDTTKKDFLNFSQEFCEATYVDPTDWRFFEDSMSCFRYLVEEVVLPKRAILITCGSLGIAIIPQIHAVAQLHSIYVYCGDLLKYKDLPELYPKILGVCDNPVQLSHNLQPNFEKRQMPFLPPPPPKSEPVERFFWEETPWSPWESRSGTRLLLERDQVTIIIRQTESIPFKVILSNTGELLGIQTKEKYSIIVHVQKGEVTIGTFINCQVSRLDSTCEPDQVLQMIEGNEEQTYWICLSPEKLTLTFGIGEMRPSFSILEAQLDPRHAKLISEISHLHATIKGVWKDFSTIEHLRTKIRFFLSSARLFEPALIIRTSSSRAGSSHSGLALKCLPERCQDLYESLLNFKLAIDDFPELFAAIESSIQSPHGWCHQRLEEKRQLFGRHRYKTAYLRLTLDRFVIEIWPPGHSSPIHHHPDAYGMFRVLRGSLLISLFPSLSLNLNPSTAKKYSLHQDQVTWMLPGWNQTHQMGNVESESCILLQCYDTEQIHLEHEPTREFFRYLDTQRRTIREMQPTSDMSFGAFKEKIKDEWNRRSIT